jgi:hypothetical protein
MTTRSVPLVPVAHFLFDSDSHAAPGIDLASLARPELVISMAHDGLELGGWQACELSEAAPGR